MGIVLIAIQRFSWWTYHFLFLFTPTGVLGVRGADVLCDFLSSARSPRALGPVLLTALIVTPGVAALTIPAGQKLSAHIEIFINDGRGVREFQQAINTDYANIHTSTRFLLDTAARRGKIYVFGDPLYYYLSGRESALPIVGWPWNYFLQSQWLALPAQLNEARPPYIYIDKHNKSMMKIRGGGVLEFIEAHYTPLFKDFKGVWWGAKPKSWSD